MEGPSPDEQAQVWLFSANEDYYRSIAKLYSARIGMDSMDAVRRAVRRGSRQPHAGDVAILWQSRPQKGIVAVGVLTTEPRGEKVGFRYDYIPSWPIPPETLMRNPILRDMEVLHTTHPPAYYVTDEQWIELQAVLPLTARPGR